MAHRDKMLPVRITQAGLDELDRLRGEITRSEFIRQLLAKASAEDRKNK